MEYIPRLPDESVNVSEVNPLTELVVLLGGMVAVVGVLYFLLGFAVDLTVQYLPVEMERRLGEMMRVEFRGQPGAEQRRLQRLVDELVEGLPEPPPFSLKVHVSKADHINAVALPGGNIVVFSGLLKEVPNDEALVFVLAHEIGHFQHRDHLRAMGRGLLLALVSLTLLGQSDMSNNIIGGTINLALLTHSREQESAADRFALDLLQRRYGRTNGAEAFFKVLLAKENMPRFASYFSTHPHPGKRLADLKSQLQRDG